MARSPGHLQSSGPESLPAGLRTVGTFILQAVQVFGHVVVQRSMRSYDESRRLPQPMLCDERSHSPLCVALKAIPQAAGLNGI
eukprot:CAMPEP_0179142010 /NCGR_PEP_ID=MMETSP0796-20121207/68170_1 /TAXON_ID=73915 /ORGANISM="Pyrodinium bahamense, Strain pbaha01" /LENGTH=82 /DNA_ID=CAMNT_0020841829 /DNA_START=130 /DNA_END=378 /DNA_ORIENTATION=-